MAEAWTLVLDTPKVSHEIIDGEVVAIDSETGTYLSLTGAAVPLWELLAAGTDRPSALAALSARYEVDETTLAADVDAALATLVEAGVVRVTDGTTAAPGAGEPAPYEQPVVEVYTDMQDLLLFDPIHEVNASGVAEDCLVTVDIRSLVAAVDTAVAERHQIEAPTTHRRVIAGDLWEVRTSGEVLDDFARSLGEAASGTGATALAVDAVHDPDGEVPGAEFLPAWLDPGSVERHDERWLVNDDATTVLVDRSGRLHQLDRASGSARWWAAGTMDRYPWEAARPFHQILDWWGAERDRWLVHAGALAWGDGAVLVVGGSGAGKSTTCAAAAAAGLEHLGDDLCLVEPGIPPLVHRAYTTTKLLPDAVTRLGLDSADGSGPLVDGKTVFRLPTATGSGSVRLVGVLVLEIGDASATTTAPTARGTALRALAPGSTLNFPVTAKAKFPVLASLLRVLPAETLVLGSDPAGVAPAVMEVVERWR